MVSTRVWIDRKTQLFTSWGTIRGEAGRLAEGGSQ